MANSNNKTRSPLSGEKPTRTGSIQPKLPLTLADMAALRGTKPRKSKRDQSAAAHFDSFLTNAKRAFVVDPSGTEEHVALAVRHILGALPSEYVALLGTQSSGCSIEAKDNALEFRIFTNISATSILIDWTFDRRISLSFERLRSTDFTYIDSGLQISALGKALILSGDFAGWIPREANDISNRSGDSDGFTPQIDRRRRTRPLANPDKPSWAEENRLTEPLRIRFSKGMLSAIDKEAAEKSLTRTDVVRAAIAAHLKIDPI